MLHAYRFTITTFQTCNVVATFGVSEGALDDPGSTSQTAASMAVMRTLALLVVGLAHLISAEFVVPTEVGSPVAYYALDEGTGFELRESISGAAAAGKVIYDPGHQTVAYDQPNWVNVRRPPVSDVAIGEPAPGIASHRRGPTLRESA